MNRDLQGSIVVRAGLPNKASPLAIELEKRRKVLLSNTLFSSNIIKDMSSYLKDTALADFAHFVSRGKLFTPVEKRQGFVIPEKYLKKEGRSKPSPTPASSSPTSEETRIALEEDGEAGKEKGGAGNGDYIIVDWYSKDDPEDPKVSFLNVSIINKSVY